MSLSTIDELRIENERLAARVAELEKKLEFLGRHQTLARGISGEKLISSMIGGELTMHTAQSDLVLPSGINIEIKHSAINSPHASKNYASGRRWQWGKVLGETNEKVYDFLVLVGEADPNFGSKYKDPDSPYVIFCIPSEDVIGLTTQGARNSLGIRLGTNPASLRAGAANKLYSDYQVTVDELIAKFGRSIDG